jgi:hypothetical protein
LASAEDFDPEYILKNDLSWILGHHIPILMLTDSESLFNTLTRANYTIERRLLIDIATDGCSREQAFLRTDVTIARSQLDIY